MQPIKSNPEYRRLPDHVMHDLGLEAFCKAASDDDKERRLITNVLSQITDDVSVADYRRAIFADILKLPELRTTTMQLFERIQFLKDFSTMHRTSDEELGLWHLFHRLDELDDYIRIVETMRDCLSDERIQSEGLKNLKDYVASLYEDACFAEMKTDIAALKMKTSEVQSVTLGINVNERFEATSIGLVSVNRKPFKKSNIVSNFADAVAAKDKIRDNADWDGDLHYQLIEKEEKRGMIEYMKEEGLDYLPEELQERFVKTREYNGTDLKELEAFLYPGDMGMYRWDGGKDFDVSYEVQIVYRRGGEKAKRYGDFNYYYFVKGEVPENVVEDLAL